MTHCSDDDLVLHFYGEERQGSETQAAVERHLADCAECVTRYQDLASALALITPPPTPERDERYGLEVWQRIRHRLPEREPMWRLVWGRWKLAVVAPAAAALLVAGFVAGRVWPGGGETVQPTAPFTQAAAGSDETRRRVLLLSVADHLERSDRLLTDIVNAGAEDISFEQQAAADLLATSRLYRHDAEESDERSVAAVLDDLERTLVDIVNRPAMVTDAELDMMRRRIDSAALLFKVRVMSDELRRREQPAPAAPPTYVSPSRTS